MYRRLRLRQGLTRRRASLQPAVRGRDAPREREHAGQLHPCKTPPVTAMVNSEGDSAYQKPFAEVLMQMTEPISCYNCHENDPTKTTVTRSSS